MTPDYEYVLKYGDPRVAVYPLMDSPTTMLFIIAIYFIFVKYVGPTWMKNRPPYSFRSVMIVYNLSISAFNMWLFINFGVYGWFTKYKLRCEPVDFSSNDDALKMVQLCWLFFASRFLEFADTIFAVLRKKDSFVSKIHLFHHCIAPVISWNSANYGPGGYNTNLMFIVSFMHTWLYLYYFLSVKTEGRPWGKTYITLMQVISLFITCLYYFQLYFFAPDSCTLSPYLLRINLGTGFVFFNINLYTYIQMKAKRRITKKKI